MKMIRNGYGDIGSLCRGSDGESLYIKLADGVKITIDGKEIANRYINAEGPTTKYDRMIASGAITEEEYNEKTARFAEDGDLSFIRLELNAKVK